MANEYTYTDSDDTREIVHEPDIPVSDDVQTEYNEIEGIEADYYESADEAEPLPDMPFDPDEISSPEHPLYDAQGNRIPFGKSRKEWEKIKKDKKKAKKTRPEVTEEAVPSDIPMSSETETDREEAVFTEETEPTAPVSEESISEPDFYEEPAAIPVPERDSNIPSHAIQEESGYTRVDNIGDEYIQDNFAGHGEKSIVGEPALDTAPQESLDTVPSEYIPENWQNNFDYTVDESTDTITLTGYHGNEENVFIPAEAHENNKDYKVKVEGNDTFFEHAETEVSSFKVADEVFVENYEKFYAFQQTHDEAVKSHEEQDEVPYGSSTPQTEEESVFHGVQSPVFTEKEGAEQLSEDGGFIPNAGDENPIEEPSDFDHTGSIYGNNELPHEGIITPQNEEITPSYDDNIPADNPPVSGIDYTPEDSITGDESIHPEAPFVDGGENTETPSVAEDSVPVGNADDSNIPGESSYQPLENGNTVPETNITAEDNAVQDYRDLSSYQQTEIEDKITKEAVERNAESSHQDGSFGDFVGSESSLNEMLKSDMTGDGSENFRQKENEAEFYYDSIGTTERRISGYEVDEYGEKKEVFSKADPKEKLVASTSGVSVAGSVVVEGSQPIDGYSGGEYGTPSPAMAGMMSNTDTIADKIGSDVGLNTSSVNIGELNEVSALTPEQARRELIENYINERPKESDARRSGLDEIVTGKGLDTSRPEREDIVEETSRELEKKAKTTLINSDGVTEVILEGVAAAGRAAGGATGVEENDAGRTIKKLRQAASDAKYVFGDMKLRAFASLEKYRGNLMSESGEAMAKFVKDGKISEKDFELIDTKGLSREDLRKAVLKNNETRNALKAKLKDIGCNKNEIKVFTDKAFMDRMDAGFKTRNEILKLSQANPAMFTKEELELVNSGAFFNSVKNSKEIGDITHKYFKASKNQNLANLNRGNMNSMSAMRELSKSRSSKLTDGDKAVIRFQKTTNEETFFTKKFIRKGKAHPVMGSLRFISRVDSDATRALGKFVSYVRTTVNIARIVGRIAGHVFRDTKLMKKITQIKAEIERRKSIQAAKAREAKRETAKKAKEAFDSVRDRLFAKGASSTATSAGIGGAGAAGAAGAGASAGAAGGTAAAGATGTAAATTGGATAAGASGFLASASAALASAGTVIVIVLLVILCVLEYYYMLGVALQFAGQVLLNMTNSVICAEKEDIDTWANALLELDEKKYDEALKRAQEPPEGKAWDGSKLYHYGHYEYSDSHNNYRPYPTTTWNPKRKQNWNRPNYYLDADTPLDEAHHQVSDNGIHIYYIDAEGNTIGSNTSNIKDVMTITTVMADNWLSQSETVNPIDRDEMTNFNKELYRILNPDPVYIESELYSCDGCATYPKYGEYLGGDIRYAYECCDDSIYTNYEKLKDAGVKFALSENFVISSDPDAKEYPEKLVPQTEHGCNIKASLDRDNEIEPYVPPVYARDPDTGLYLRDEDGERIVEEEAEKGVIGVKYEYSCGGVTYNYDRRYDVSFGESGAIIKNDGRAYGSTTTYATSTKIDAEESWDRAGFDTHKFYQKLPKSQGTPHAAIKCCYGHRDLNIYIPILTKDDLISTSGNAIKYKVPKTVNAATGEVEEWEEKETDSILEYIKKDTKLTALTKTFFDEDDFGAEHHLKAIENIYNEDWHDLYQIDVYGAAALPETMNRAGKDSLDVHTPAYKDITDMRLAFVKKAYKYVGEISYYYGGKATSTNYSANKFGETVTPDSLGRKIKGLDCSGFVQFVYCQAFGKDLKSVGNSTKTFCSSLGLVRTKYSDLKPGDIGLVDLPGAAKNHIGIYAGDGMWIHCSGSPVNTVVYKNTNMFRYFYRLE